MSRLRFFSWLNKFFSWVEKTPVARVVFMLLGILVVALYLYIVGGFFFGEEIVWAYIAWGLVLMYELGNTKFSKRVVKSLPDLVVLIKDFFWSIRVSISLFFFFLFSYLAYKLDIKLASVLVDGGSLALVGVALAPLITWVAVIIKKDIEIGKLRESWCYDMKRTFSSFLVKSDKAISFYRHKIDDVKEYAMAVNKAIECNDILAEVEARKVSNNKADEGVTILQDFLAEANRIDISLSWDDKKAEGVLRGLSKKLKEATIECCTYYATRQRWEGHHGAGVRFKDDYRDKLEDRQSSSYSKCLKFSNLYFAKEWGRIKSIDMEYRRTIAMLIILMMSVVCFYIIIIIRAGSIKLILV